MFPLRAADVRTGTTTDAAKVPVLSHHHQSLRAPKEGEDWNQTSLDPDPAPRWCSGLPAATEGQFWFEFKVWEGGGGPGETWSFMGVR